MRSTAATGRPRRRVFAKASTWRQKSRRFTTSLAPRSRFKATAAAPSSSSSRRSRWIRRSSKAHYSLGVILASSGQPVPAIAALPGGAESHEPGYVEARLQLAHMLRRSGQLEASLAHYAQIVKEDARVPEARFGYAAALIRLRRYGEARDYLAAAITRLSERARVRERGGSHPRGGARRQGPRRPRALRFIQPVLVAAVRSRRHARDDGDGPGRGLASSPRP